MGIMEDYVQKAIDEKIDIFGFSDHNPMELDKKHRMEYKYKDDYKNMFQSVKKQFEKEIKLLFAYEFDYLQYGMDKKILNEKLDYLIGSVHILDNFIVDDEKKIKEYALKVGQFKNKDSDSLWENYFEQIKLMAKSGYFNIVGHIDLIKLLTKEEPKKDIRLIAKDALKAIKESGMSIEINASGLRKEVKELYPSKKLLEEIYSYDIPITFGSDSHLVEHINFQKEYCENLAKEIGYTKCVYYENKETIFVDF